MKLAKARIEMMQSSCVSLAVSVLLLIVFDVDHQHVADALAPPPNVFPVSTRKALADKSKSINPTTSYTSSGWSNRAATVLTPQSIDPVGVYTADRPFYWNNIDVGCRCTIIELPSTTGSDKPDLWVHSPVGIDGPLQKSLEQIGNVKYVVSPNYEHVKFAPQWYQTYPDCEMWGCPGLAEKMADKNIQFTGEIPFGYRPPGYKGKGSDSNTLSWDTSIIQPLHIDIEVNPFTGKPFFNEVIYFHTPTKTLIMTDLFWNYPSDGVPNSQYGQNDSWELAPLVDQVPLGSRLWKFGMDQVYYPFFSNFMVQNKDEYKDIANHIVNVWGAEMVIPAHGDILRGKEFIRNILKKHFQL